jgi:putative ABC transport system permease protein
MLRNYVKIALRNLWRNKVFSLINVLGLSIGLRACLLIAAYVQDETHYDRFAARAETSTASTWVFPPPRSPTIPWSTWQLDRAWPQPIRR